MTLELEAADGSRATQMLFKATEIKVVKLVLGTLLSFSPRQKMMKGPNSKILTVLCHSLEKQGSAQALQPAGVAAADSLPSDGSQEEPVVNEEITKEDFVEKLRGWMMVLASLFASMTFRAGINPPKKFWPNVARKPNPTTDLRDPFPKRRDAAAARGETVRHSAGGREATRRRRDLGAWWREGEGWWSGTSLTATTTAFRSSSAVFVAFSPIPPAPV
ncbi:unnamed protein product [Urochloa humidicola]